MNQRNLLSVLFIMLFMAGVSVRGQSHILKITDVNGLTTLVSGASSSSSTSCNSPDFPVLRGGSRKDVDFRELSLISVVHDQSANDPDIYIKVELTLKDGAIEEYEMIRNIRFTGNSDQGDFSIMVKEIATVQIRSGNQ